MTSEHILDAIGLLDDELVREAEEYRRPRARFDCRRWGSLAACCALVFIAIVACTVVIGG